MSTTQLTFETVPVTSIKTFGDNPRHHSKHQIRRIAASIQEFGFTNPALVDECDELIAGHGRLAAAALLGLSHIPVIRLAGLKDHQKRALRIADNRIGERSAWSKDLLAKELKHLIDMQVDVELTGFDAIEVDSILTIDPDCVEDEPEIAPPPDRPVTQLGDLWELGSSVVLCGDARDPASYERVLRGAVADMIITDVPYNVPIAGHVSGLGRKTHGEFEMASGEMSREQFREFLRVTLSAARDASRDGSLHYVCIDWRSVADLITIGRELFSEFKNLICWAKANAAMGSLYRSQHELIAVFKHGRARHVNNIQLGRLGRYRSNVWQYPGASGFSKSRLKDLDDHPTVKPVQLVSDAIHDATMPGNLVLDPFGGAGTTLLAAEQVGRRAALIEIEPKYVDVTLRRFQEQSGAEPKLLPAHISFADVRQKRLRGEAA